METGYWMHPKAVSLSRTLSSGGPKVGRRHSGSYVKERAKYIYSCAIQKWSGLHHFDFRSTWEQGTRMERCSARGPRVYVCRVGPPLSNRERLSEDGERNPPALATLHRSVGFLRTVVRLKASAYSSQSSARAQMLDTYVGHQSLRGQPDREGWMDGNAILPATKLYRTLSEFGSK